MSETTSVLGGVVRRREDPALIQGTGRYVDDIKRDGMLHVAFVRSPFAHARITSVSVDDALAMDGVHAVYTAADVRHLAARPGAGRQGAAASCRWRGQPRR